MQDEFSCLQAVFNRCLAHTCDPWFREWLSLTMKERSMNHKGHEGSRRSFLHFGIGSLICYAAAALYYRRSPNLPTSAKYGIWILLLLPLGAISLRLF
jgi:hypothetical protein